MKAHALGQEYPAKKEKGGRATWSISPLTVTRSTPMLRTRRAGCTGRGKCPELGGGSQGSQAPRGKGCAQ